MGYKGGFQYNDSVKLSFKSKQALLDALESRRSWAIQLDARNDKEHKAKEKACLKEFKARLREALKWDYATLKKKGFEVDVNYRDRPGCPMSFVTELDRAIGQVRNDGRTKFRVTNNNFQAALFILTFDENATKNDICE